MHNLPAAPAAAEPDARPWYREMTRYHWFVFVVAAVGWLADCMDQQLFNLARDTAVAELRGTEQNLQFFGGLATMIFMLGWATGGLVFGVLGDRIGRAKTMMITILIYSAFTGFSALSVGFFDFALYRFLTGLGVGGEFAVGVALLAEVMPDRARPHALGLLQAFSAIGNVTAAFIGMSLGAMQARDLLGEWKPWRYEFVVGAVPALLTLVIRRRLKEPERWQALKRNLKPGEKLGSLKELLGTPLLRRHALLGLVLATSGVVGLWAIGFFGFALARTVLRVPFEAAARTQAAIADDGMVSNAALDNPGLLTSPRGQKLKAEWFLDQESKKRFQAAKDLVATDGSASVAESSAWDAAVDRIAVRNQQLDGQLTYWSSIYGLMFNIGAFFGVNAFSKLAQSMGRRPAFAITFGMALVTTAFTFWGLKGPVDLFWMVPLMGFFQIALFGGYAIYFPELFPTRLRSTGTSFCYNVGRYLASPGPLLLGALTSWVFGSFGQVDGLRYAGITMCVFFLLGIAVLPFMPETKGKPLPE
jgi:MFS family permease